MIPLHTQYHAIAVSPENVAGYAERYRFIEKNFTRSEGQTMPLDFRKLQQVQLSANTRTPEQRLGDNRSLYVKAFMASTVGFAFTAVSRMIRIAMWTIFLLPAILVRFATANRYGVEGAVPELLKRYAEEWVDLGVSIIAVPMGIVKTISPKALSGCTNTITDYYLNRADRRNACDQNMREAGARYLEAEAAARALRGDEQGPAGDNGAQPLGDEHNDNDNQAS